MPLTLNPEQILALAPDPASAKNGKSLATPRKWPTLGHNDAAVWGECQGSGSKPYQTKVDLSEMAWSCSCPSRKLPCKHTLGLLLLLQSQPQAFTQTTPPPWVEEWLASRAKRAEKRVKKQEEPLDPAAEAKRAAAQAKKASARQANIAAGLAALDTWLRDLMRQGLASVQGKPLSFWEAPAKRLNDAQAPGAAGMLRRLAATATRTDEAGRLLAGLGRLWLLVEAYQRIDSLSPATQADIRAALGLTINQDEILSQPGQRDQWLVIGQHTMTEDKLNAHYTWLWGSAAGRGALILDFIHANATVQTQAGQRQVPGTCLDAELAFYPGSYPLRALIKTHHADMTTFDTLTGYPDIPTALDAYAAALGQQPWLERFPLALQAVTLVNNGTAKDWAVRDAHGLLLPCDRRFAEPWQVLALSGGHPVVLTGEWDGSTLLPLGVLVEGRFRPLSVDV